MFLCVENFYNFSQVFPNAVFIALIYNYKFRTKSVTMWFVFS